MLDAANWSTLLAELARQSRVPGAVLGIWACGQEILAAAGLLNRVTRVRVSTDSLFQVGSITKLWTATMIMQLIDQDLLSLDTTVAQVLPGVRLGAAGLGDQVTVAHLLTHTSGIDGDIFTDTGRGDDCVERYVGLLDRAASAFPPGGAYSYCNSGWVLLGRIIEVLDGRTWDESLRERLCEPLELTQTVTLPEEAILHRAAVGHRPDGARVHVWGLPRSVGPAGLITASAHDLLTFARFHLDGGLAPDGKRLLSEASVAAMQQRLDVRARPHVYACTHLANSASLLLPVSNLTNLLAFAASGLAFGHFAALMALPWLAVIGVEYAVFGRFFGSDLSPGSAGPRTQRDAGDGAARLPVFTVTVVGLTLAGFVGASAAGVSPAWAALAGAAVLAGRALARRRATPLSLLRAADLPFGVFVLGLGIVVAAMVGNGLGSRVAAAAARPGRRCPRCWPSRRWPPSWPTSATTCRPSWSCSR